MAEEAVLGHMEHQGTSRSKECASPGVSEKIWFWESVALRSQREKEEEEERVKLLSSLAHSKCNLAAASSSCRLAEDHTNSEDPARTHSSEVDGMLNSKPSCHGRYSLCEHEKVGTTTSPTSHPGSNGRDRSGMDLSRDDLTTSNDAGDVNNSASTCALSEALTHRDRHSLTSAAPSDECVYDEPAAGDKNQTNTSSSEHHEMNHDEDGNRASEKQCHENESIDPRIENSVGRRAENDREHGAQRDGVFREDIETGVVFCACMRACVRVCVCACVYARMYMYVCIYVCVMHMT
jgi:hypothetical protein